MIGGFAASFLVVGPLASRIGDAFRRFAMPDYVFARGAADLAGQKLFWEFGPQAIAAVAAFCIMAVGLSKPCLASFFLWYSAFHFVGAK